MNSGLTEGGRFPVIMRLLALLLLITFLSACTRTVQRKPVEVREFQVDWEKLDTRRVIINGMVIEGIVLTPAQWPLEASLKRLFQLDFVGVIKDFDLSFTPSRLHHDLLKDLFDQGFLPAYVRVTNGGESALSFHPDMVTVRADEETLFYTAPLELLPNYFKKIDWEKTSFTIVIAALYVLIVLASAKEGHAPRLPGEIVEATMRVSIQSDMKRPIAVQQVQPLSKLNKGILQPKVLAPGESQEGFIFFIVDKIVPDWSRTHLDAG